jgi:DNA polymerase-3 subunit alpha
MRAAVELAGYTPSESDELRSAISKKKAKEIEKHRTKFVNGAVRQGMEKEIAEAIYSDWEEFARYGFNKSHAADYGVIAVQTAFLKAHYPAEYMAATLTASAGQTEKVALYVADARSMGVPVLPSEINASGWDFEIEDMDGKPNIRFGFGAVKNVGQGAVELITKERDTNGRFKNLNDLARRVDLRAVGKRALECIIKVGALDNFGNRSALLASLDRIVSISNNHFRAAEAGQMSLFGEATGVVEEITLPAVNNVDRREMLSWERELIGLYISDHPLTPYQETFRQIVSYFSGQLNEAQHEEKICIAGLVTNVRPYMTKTNKPMGFVTLEDIQGNFDLVLFPRTWEKTREMLTVGQIVIVEGKVDTNSVPPKILVDTVRTEIRILEPLGVDKPPQSKPQPFGQTQGKPAPDLEALSQPKPDNHVKDIKIQSKQPRPIVPVPKQPVMQVAEKPVGTYKVDQDLDGMPPPPDNFPDDWDAQWQPSFDEAAIAAQPEPKFKKKEEITPPRVQLEPAPMMNPDVDADQAEAEREAVVTSLKSIYIPLVKEDEKEHPPKQITVNLRSSGNKEEDRRRIKTIYGTLISFHGRDRFSFQIFENGGRHLIDFPNDTTRICPELLQRLLKLMGEESWRVEEITLQ